MHSSTWLPWLFFGPLLTAMISGIAYQALRTPWLGTLAQISLALCTLVAVAAFAAARAGTKGKSPP